MVYMSHMLEVNLRINGTNRLLCNGSDKHHSNTGKFKAPSLPYLA